MTRTDIHRPAAIQPDDYEFVSFDHLPGADGDLGHAMFLADQRKYKRDHMTRTGGLYSQHEHGGQCHICGSVNAIYIATFFHAKSNSYIHTGLDCADKLQCEGIEAFRKNVQAERAVQAGKRKAQATLVDAGLANVWAIWEAVQVKRADYTTDDEGIDQVKVSENEWTLTDIVGKLIKYGSISDKQQSFLAMLAKKIENNEPSRKEVWAAQRAAENAAAADVPAIDGRMIVEGEIVTLRAPDDSAPFPAWKMLVKHESGWKVWGSLPSSIDGAKVGDRVRFQAAVKRSGNDSKFGFYSRPTKAEVLS